MDKTVLVTGGAGFIGSHLIERLLSQGYQVVSLDNFNSSYPPAFKWQNIQPLLSHPAFTLVQGDIRDRSLLSNLFSRYSFQAVVHLAGLAGVRPSVEEPHLYQEVNILGTLNLLEESRNKVDRFVFASSSSVYGNNPCHPLREDMLPSPVSPYGASKAGA